MIELRRDTLRFSFPDVHPRANLDIEFERTLRIPNDGSDYPLPPGLGAFPLRHVDDFAERVPAPWLEHGGVMLPMYQSEALWIRFRPERLEAFNMAYPFAVKIAAGKVCAVSGEGWSNQLHRNPQDYLVLPKQPWLDGYCVKKGLIRQFVAMPLGSGYSAEEQLTGEAEHGGIQIIVRPMRREAFERLNGSLSEVHWCWVPPLLPQIDGAVAGIGLAPGGRMRQEVYEDPFDFEDWDRDNRSRCFVHLANSLVWRDITDEDPPTTPPTAREYAHAGLPWFEWYDDSAIALAGGERLKGLKSVAELEKTKGDVVLSENQSVTPQQVVELRRGLRMGQVREGRI